MVRCHFSGRLRVTRSLSFLAYLIDSSVVSRVMNARAKVERNAYLGPTNEFKSKFKTESHTADARCLKAHYGNGGVLGNVREQLLQDVEIVCSVRSWRDLK